MIPEKFLEEMKSQLPDSWEKLFACYQEPPWHGYRWNVTKLIKAGAGTAEGILHGEEEAPLIDDEPVPWCGNGRYQSRPGMGKLPLYYAGAYYIQEPSAMLPAAMLAARPGDRVLDLCAAPGGKSTQLLDDMRDTGLLVSNDISASRGKAIVRNLERFGFRSFLVTAERPESLAIRFPAYFDKILVDAPCSGEGMFRREPDMGQEWEEKGPSYYAPIQREILGQAASMLRPGGRLVYSTCTFSREEDEETARWLLRQCPELELVCQQKLMPHQVRGEGQYAACFEKRLPDNDNRDQAGRHIPDDSRTDIQQDIRNLKESRKADRACSQTAFLEQLASKAREMNRNGGARKEKKGPGTKQYLDTKRESDTKTESLLDFMTLIDPEALGWNPDQLYGRDDQLYLVPTDLEPYRGLRFLRTGLLLGSWKKDRFEPSQALAMYLNSEVFRNTICFSGGDDRVRRYLKGETIDCTGARSGGGDGWCLVLMDGLPLGFARRTDTTLKNKYDPGWRMLS